MRAFTECPYCQMPFIESISIEGIETQSFTHKGEAKRYILENIKIKNIHRMEQFKETLIQIKPYLRDNILVSELRDILIEEFNIASISHIEIIWQLEEEFNMYIPDHKHLCFVRPELTV